MGEGRRISLLTHGHETSPGAVGGFKLGVSLGFRENTNGGAAAATRQRRQGSESSLGATELIDQGTEGGRSDILAADQPEPVPPLTIAQLDLSA